MNLWQKFVDKIESHGLWESTMTLKRNEYLKVGGSVDTNIYFIVRGSMRVFVVDEFEEHTIRFGYQNNIIAALDSFITEGPSDLYIQAIKKTELKVAKKKAFMDWVQKSPGNLSLWHKILENMIYQQMERERDILTSSPAERYKRVLKRSPQLFQEIPNKYIAAYLRMTPETLSRLKKS